MLSGRSRPAGAELLAAARGSRGKIFLSVPTLPADRTPAGMDAFETGLTRPLTFGPNRRVGVEGGGGVALDLERMTVEPVSPWRGGT